MLCLLHYVILQFFCKTILMKHLVLCNFQKKTALGPITQEMTTRKEMYHCDSWYDVKTPHSEKVESHSHNSLTSKRSKEIVDKPCNIFSVVNSAAIDNLFSLGHGARIYNPRCQIQSWQNSTTPVLFRKLARLQEFMIFLLTFPS